MNKNKGIIGIGLLIAIVLGIVVVGGGAYYLGKSKGENKNKEVVKTEENNSHEVPAGPYGTASNYSDNSFTVNSGVVSTPQKCIDAAASLLPAYISKGELLDLKLNKVDFFVSKSDASNEQYFYPENSNDACMVSISYSVKPKPEQYKDWTAGNGHESSDGWILNKSGNAIIDKNSSGYYVYSVGSGL